MDSTDMGALHSRGAVVASHDDWRFGSGLSVDAREHAAVPSLSGPLPAAERRSIRRFRKRASP